MNLFFDSFLEKRIKLWSERPVTILYVFCILSYLLLKTKSIHVSDELLILVGPVICCERSKLFVIDFKRFRFVLSFQFMFLPYCYETPEPISSSTSPFGSSCLVLSQSGCRLSHSQIRDERSK